MRVLDCNPDATRAFIASTVEVSADPVRQRETLFDPSIPDDVARVESVPAASGSPGRAEPREVRITEDGGGRLTVEARLPAAGLLVIRDNFDPSWTAQVDDVPAPIVRANGLYRAVAVPAGRHVIRFSYRPWELAAGLILTMIGAAVVALRRFSRRRDIGPAAGAAGFTLIELMVVLAIVGILLAVAFTEYRGMQARGNEASAVASLRDIATAQWQFALTCGNGKYAATLPALGVPVPATGHAFLSPDLATADPFEKSGYIFHMAAKALDAAEPACNGAQTSEGYAATADPVRPGASGRMFYGVNAERILLEDGQQSFTENLPESGSAGHGAEVK